MMNLDLNNDSRRQRVYTTMYLKRIFSLRQMDLDYTFSQMIQICLSPAKVYKMTAWRKQTKNQWARDDPSFIVVSLFFAVMISIAYSIALRPMCISCLLQCTLQTFFYSLVLGLAIATVSWYLSNHYMRIQRPHSPEQFVEWLYALDIHFNSFFPYMMIMGILQYIMLPILLKDNWFAVICSGLLFIAGIAAYTYITFLGYMYQPFIKTPFIILVIGGCICCGVLFTMACGINLTKWWVGHYFFKVISV